MNQPIVLAPLHGADLVLFEGMDAQVTEVEFLPDGFEGELALKTYRFLSATWAEAAPAPSGDPIKVLAEVFRLR